MCKSSSELLAAIEALKSEVHALSSRVAVLERRPKPARDGAPTPTDVVHLNGSGKHAEPISEEIVLVISAAVAAFLGERRHIRQIRLIGTHSWAVQGRVSVQASHLLHHS